MELYIGTILHWILVRGICNALCDYLSPIYDLVRRCLLREAAQKR
jgi:hypothetical protein